MNSHCLPARVPRAFFRGAALAVALALVFISPTTSSAKPKENHKPKPEFSSVCILGDSLSDTGRLYAAIGIPPAPAYWNGRSSNGPLWPEYFSPSVGLDYDPFDNFAWTGANTGRINAWEADFGIDLPGVLDELDEYIAGLGRHPRADKKALYVVFAGSNDFFRILAGGEDPNVIIPEAVINIMTVVSTLQTLGAQDIVVVNLPDLGLTPRVRVIDSFAPGTADVVTGLCAVFNMLLSDALDGLSHDVIRADAFSAINAWVADATAYGFTNVTDPGLLSGTDGDTYFFWDDIHPTTRVHALLAETILEAIDDAAMNTHKRHGYDFRPRHALCRP